MLTNVHLGCGYENLIGFVNADVTRTDATDVVFDASQPWPFPENSVGYVFAKHMLEHVPDFFGLFREMWKSMADGGKVFFSLPYGAHEMALADPFHLKPWYGASFAFLLPRAIEFNRNVQHADWTCTYIIESVQLRVDPALFWLLRWPFRYIAPRVFHFLWNAYLEIGVTLRAIKSEAMLQRWYDAGGKLNVVPLMIVKQFDRRSYDPE